MYASVWDILLPPLYLIVIFFIANNIKRKYIKNVPEYKYFIPGLFAKILGGISFTLVYLFYYKGGDTLNYYYSSCCLLNLASKNFTHFIEVFFQGNTNENYLYFDASTGFPCYWNDYHSTFLTRFITPIVFLGGQSFISSAIILAALSYSGIWKMFLLFSKEFPLISKQMAISILFIPSVVFWGSGLMKDTVTLSAVAWYIHSFYYFAIQKKISLKYLVSLLVSSYVLIAIKPYIFFALMPGSITWFTVSNASKINSKILRSIAVPFFILAGFALGFYALTNAEDLLGQYKIDSVLDKAAAVQKDQKQAYYGGNSFDIGDVDPTLTGALSKTHLAIAATFFRPYLWDVKNGVMLLSAVENTYILLLTLLLLIKLKVIGFVSIIAKNPLLFFSVLFALFFGFSVGLATSNFGSLVRLKIPCIPFFVASLFIIRHFYELKTNKKLGL